MLPDDYYLVKQMQEHDSQLAFTHLSKSMGGLFMCCVIIICILQSWRRMLYRISFLGSGTKGVLKIKTHLSETFFLPLQKITC